VDFANANRLIVINKASMMRPLPISYGDAIAHIGGVTAVSHFTFFGGQYQSAANPVAVIATDVRKFPAMVSEITFLDKAGLQSWFADPGSVAVGRQLARRYDWHVGDVIPIYSMIYPRRDGNAVWSFRIATIFDASEANGKTDSMVVNYRYFDEERMVGQHTVGWYAAVIDDARKAPEIGRSIDRLFENSPDETSSVTERAFAQSFLQQVGDFRAMIMVALSLVFWTLILITANTMSQAIDERGAEIAVMKTIGFTGSRVAGIILLESVGLLGFGGALGLGLAATITVVVAAETSELLSTLTVAPTDWLIGLSLACGIGVLVGAVPALRAGRAGIINGLAEAI
jgi:putative ABC transport system permease protein